MADGLAFIYLFPDRCIHPCPGEHSRMPWPMDLHLYIYFHPAASTHVPVSIPECHGQWTGIFCFFSVMSTAQLYPQKTRFMQFQQLATSRYNPLHPRQHPRAILTHFNRNCFIIVTYRPSAHSYHIPTPCTIVSAPVRSFL